MIKADHNRKKSIPGKKKPPIDRRRLSRYGAEALVIGTVVTAALFLPQFIFWVEDNILCGDTALGRRESMDVESQHGIRELSGCQDAKFCAGTCGKQKVLCDFTGSDSE